MAAIDAARRKKQLIKVHQAIYSMEGQITNAIYELAIFVVIQIYMYYYIRILKYCNMLVSSQERDHERVRKCYEGLG